MDNGNGQPGSFLEQARQARERLAAPRTNDFDLPGYAGILRVRYGVIPYRRTLEIAESILKQGQSAGGVEPADAHLYEAAESLSVACKCFLRRDDDGEWIPWTVNDEPVRYDAKLVAELELPLPETPRPRDIVYELFGGLSDGKGERPLMTHYYTVMGWMDDLDAEVTDEHLGKSERKVSFNS